MSVWDDEDFTREIVRRYLAGEGAAQLARAAGLTRNQVITKLARLGIRRGKPSLPQTETAPAQIRSKAATTSERRRQGARPSMGTRYSVIDRVRRAFAYGPKSQADLVEMLERPYGEINDALNRLRKAGEVERIEVPGQHALWRRISGPEKPSRGASFRALEDAFVAARARGEPVIDIARRLKLTDSATEKFESAFRAQTTSGHSSDSSCPKFAKHEKHLGMVWKAKGFPAFSERRRGTDHIAVCLPVIWPEVRA